MLPENKKNGDRSDLGSTPSRDGFDRLLKDALEQYRQPTPAGFPQRMLSRLEQFEQQEALRKVVRQERILLAACILLPVTVVILILFFPDILLVPTQLYETVYLLAKGVGGDMIQHWRSWLNYAAAAAVMIYAAYAGLVADN